MNLARSIIGSRGALASTLREFGDFSLQLRVQESLDLPDFSAFSFDFDDLRQPRERLRNVLLGTLSRGTAPLHNKISEFGVSVLSSGWQITQTVEDDEGLVAQLHPTGFASAIFVNSRVDNCRHKQTPITNVPCYWLTWFVNSDSP